ncbi:MAG: carboxypeptidase regulatory-like domain-containing protein [Candidatus Solibacter sp.]
MKQVLALSLCALTFVAGAYAQATAGLGSVSGTVRDASGAAVPGATVVVANEDKGIKRTMTSTDAGVFAAPALVPSSGYSVTVTKAGFSTYEVKAFEIAVGQNVDFKIGLQVGAATTRVDVSAEAPLVENTKQGVTSTVSSDQILSLPINGRRVDSFVLLTPAVTNDGEFGLLSFRGTAAGNSFLTDGNDTTNSFYNESAGRTRIGSQVSQDAVQEFQVLSNGFSAEFGRAMGGVVNTVTRSGGNDVHGTIYWFFRNRTLEAADRYANGVKTPEWRHATGMSLGGPIKKDKLFYFSNFDFTKRNFPGLNRIVNNTITDATGNFIPASACLTSGSATVATPAQCAAAAAFVQKQMNVVVPRGYDQLIGFLKLDWRPNDRHTFSFSGNVMHWDSPHGNQTQAVVTNGSLLGSNGNSTVENRVAKAAWTVVVNANAVNELRYGWFKDRLADSATGDLFPKETGPLTVSIAGSSVGAAIQYPRIKPSENRSQIVDNYSWTIGAHSLKFGADFSTTSDYINQLETGAGSYSYTNMTNFARDFSDNTAGVRSYSSFTQRFGQPVRQYRTTDINLYFQDTWKISRYFTASYGVRYEKAWLPQPPSANKDYPDTGSIPSASKNFSPRFNLSYSPNDRTVFRLGYGIFYARIHGNLLDTLYLGSANAQSVIFINNTQAGAPLFPNALSSGAGLPTGTVNLNTADRTFHNPYTQQGTLAVERQLTRDMGLTVSYIWTRGIGLFVQRDLNLANPVGPYTYLIADAAGNNVGSYSTMVFPGRRDSRYGKILQVENGAQSWYNALAVQFQRRFSHGFQAQVSYTWAHAIDNGNEQGASFNIDGTFNNAMFNGDYKQDKASSTSIDQRHRASINWIWRPTFTKSTSFVAKNLVNGWELSTITTLASAKGATPTVNSPSTALGAVFPGVALAYGTANGSGGWNRVPFLPPSSLDIDQTYQFDARITRSIPISERVKLNLSFEAFNAANTIRNTSVQTAAYTISGNVFRPILTNGVSIVGNGTASQGFPDGTNARRAQVAARLTF